RERGGVEGRRGANDFGAQRMTVEYAQPGTAPRVSVLLPVYNAEATLEAALLSILRQTLPDFECVAVDDGSSDGSFAVLERFARLDRRVRAVRAPHGGLIAALNLGLAQCRGQFVARMDADDAMHPERLAAQSAALERRADLAGLGCHVRLFPARQLKPKRLAYADWLNAIQDEEQVFAARFIECPLAHPTWFMRREVMVSYGYRDRGWPEDYDLVLRLLAEGHRLGIVPRQLLFWRDSTARLSRTHPAYAQSRFVSCKAEFLASSWLAEQDRYVLWGYGDTGRELRRALLVYGKTPRAIVELHPGRLGQRIHGAEVIPPSGLARLAKSVPIVVSVAGATARGLIREQLHSLGFEPERHYVFAA
ncbi:MAG TPA: glycosyltransferase family A protein, partial [Polyangiaceae bacterium]|nr:glycosyltransferase family A protein [Polyangiaceae bacterium]